MQGVVVRLDIKGLRYCQSAMQGGRVNFNYKKYYCH
jgi:hypothetical protein